MKKYLKYTLRGLGIFIGILVLIYAGLYLYVLANKKDIVERVRKQIGEEITGNVKIADIDLSFFTYFPKVSVVVKDVLITDTMYTQHRHPFFKAEKVYARISLFRLIQKKDPLNGLRVDNGQLYVFTDTTGYTNSYLFSGKKEVADTVKSKGSSVISDISLRNVRLVMNNEQREKLYDFAIARMDTKIETTDSSLFFRTTNNILIHNIAFNLAKGSFATETLLEGNLDVLFKKNRKQLSFNNLVVNLKGHPFGFSGYFNLGDERTFNLKISTANVGYEFARSLLTTKIAKALSRFKAEKPVDVVAEIGGPLKGEPLVMVKWSTVANNIQTPFLNTTNATFKGSYTNELIPGLPRVDDNSRVEFHDFTGDWEGLTFKSDHVYIDNLTVPMVNGDVRTNFNLSELNTMLQSNALKLNAGTGTLDIVYSGPLQENTNKNTLINGKVVIRNGLIAYKPRNILIKNCNGNIIFKNSDVLVSNVSANVEGNSIKMNGRANNLLSLIKTSPGKISLDWNVYSPELNLQTFASLLQKRTKVAVAVNPGGAKLGKLANSIDQMLDQSNIRLDLKADKVKFKKFIANKVVASIGLFEDSYNLNKISMQHGGGAMQIMGSLRGVNEYYQEAKMKVNMDNVDVNKVFYSFDNFGQDAMMSDNIQGKLTTAIDIRMDIDRQLQKHPQNLAGYVDFSLKNGALINFEPMQKLQNFLFKNRDFSDIRFAELKNRFDILNRDIKINRMEIQSTALSLWVEGIYSLKGNTDVSIQVPLSNLRSRSKDYKPENLGADAKGGTSVFIRGRPGEDGNIKFKYDLFKKFRGDNKD